MFLKIEQNLNLVTARYVERLAEDARHVCLDLSEARIVDSEGVIMLYRLVKAGKNLHIRKPPKILEEIIQILSLGEVIDLDRLATDTFESCRAGD